MVLSNSPHFFERRLCRFKTPRDNRLGVNIAPYNNKNRCALKTKNHSREPCTDLYGPNTNLVAHKNQVWLLCGVDIYTYAPRLLSDSKQVHAHIAYSYTDSDTFGSAGLKNYATQSPEQSYEYGFGIVAHLGLYPRACTCLLRS